MHIWAKKALTRMDNSAKKVLMRIHICAGSSESSLLAYAKLLYRMSWLEDTFFYARSIAQRVPPRLFEQTMFL